MDKGVTTGTSATTFTPAKDCTRAEVVTFLYRAKGSTLSAPDGDAFYEFSGTGNKNINDIDLPKDDYYVGVTYYGGTLNMKLRYGDEENDVDSFFSEYAADDYMKARCVLDCTRDEAVVNGVLEIEGAGAWTVKMYRVDSLPVATTNISGTGTTVTGCFTATSENNTVSMTYQQTTRGYFSNYIVWVYEFDGVSYRRSCLANSLCTSAQGDVELTLTPGKQYYFSIMSSGNWTIDFGNGDARTTYNECPAYY